MRGLAAFSVLIHHTLLTMFPPLRAIYTSTAPFAWGGAGWWMTHTPLHLLWLGAEDVFVFFILSGIVLTIPLLRRSTFSWKRYYPSRLVRLYLPVWASLVVVVGLTVLVLYFAPGRGGAVFASRLHDLVPLRLLRDAVLVSGVSSVDGVLWSLQWEMLFSLTLPIFFLLLVRIRRWGPLKLVLILLVCAGSAPFVLTHGRTAAPAFYLMMFAAGVLFAASFERLQAGADMVSRHGRLGWSLIIATACMLLCAYWFVLLASPPEIVLDGSRFISFLGALVLVFVAAFSPVAVRLLEMRVPQWLGKVSFSLYLTHAIILEVFVAFGPAGMQAVSALLGALLALPVAVLFQRTVEGPTHRLSQHLKRRAAVPLASVPNGAM